MALQWFKEEQWGWAHQSALAVLNDAASDSRSLSLAKIAIVAVEKKASQAVVNMERIMDSTPARKWVSEWFEFRRQFGATVAADELVAEYDAAREK